MLSGCDWSISIRSTKTVVNASLESFVHKALKDEQIKCIHRIVCHGRDVLAVLPTRQERYISVNFKSVVSYGPYSQRHIKNHRSTPCFLLAYKVQRSASETYSLRTKQEHLFYKINHIFVGRTVQHCM